ncbi:hypothetical protein N8600_06370 [Gammaproteobacteria bacterium]|nr:hypothetical protein [Gammaproteobacteria bacterium]
MNTDDTDKPARRKSDLPLLGKTSQDFENRVYTLDFKVNLTQITFEGLSNYAVTISCFDKDTQQTESISSVLDISLKQDNNSLIIEGGPTVFFSVNEDTLDLSDLKLDEGIVEAVTNGIAWLKDGRTTERVENRRQVPRELLEDRIAMNLLMSSISTIIAGSMECHQKVIKEKQRLFTHKNDYIDAMYECLQRNLDDLTVVAINRGVQYYVDHS